MEENDPKFENRIEKEQKMENLENLVKTMKKMSGEELYLKALEYKEKKDYCNYRMYLCMSANHSYEKLFKNINIQMNLFTGMTFRTPISLVW